MKTLIEYFLEKFWNISENRIVKVSMDAHELTNLLRTKQTKLCVSCEEIEGEILYEDLMTFDEAITSIPDKIYHYVSMSRTAILRIFSNFSQEENEQILSKIIERTGIQDIHVEVKTEESTDCLLELELF